MAMPDLISNPFIRLDSAPIPLLVSALLARRNVMCDWGRALVCGVYGLGTNIQGPVRF
jgi:hypothetical protein